MLSLPLIPPQLDLLPTHFRLRSDSPPRTQNQDHLPPHQRQPHHHASKKDKQPQIRNSPLHLLQADEAAIQQRKFAVRNFGAYWIRPPGVSKTLQAMTEEAAELAEQEEMARQEQGLRDMQALQQVEEARNRADEVGQAEAEAEEVDLDDEVPEAEAQDMEGVDDDVTFNEESLVWGSRTDNAMEEAELTGAAREEEELGVEHDLDESIPEAGSYQHTDTEMEDSSEEDSSQLQDSFVAQSARRRQPIANALPPAAGLQERIRAQMAGGGVGTPAGNPALTRSPGSINLSSSLLESSFVGSSPVARRDARGRGGRRGRMS